MIGADQLIPTLLSAGVLAAADAVRRRVELVPIGRSHPVFRLEVDGAPVAAVKLFGERRGETDGEAAREAAVHALAEGIPALARLLPPRLAHAGPRSLIVCGWFAGRPAWEGDSLVGGGPGDPAADLAALVPAIAPPLAAMHRATARLVRDGGLPAALAGPEPWGLRLFDGDSPADLWQYHSVAPLLARAGARPLLVAGIRRARGAWRAVALIHADLKHDNLLVAGDGRVAVVDWEMARAGDPAWDLAGLMVRPLLDAAPGRRVWTDAHLGAASALVSAYCAASGLKPAPIAQRLILYCGVWLVMSLIQFTSVAPEDDREAGERLLEGAEICFTRCDRLVARLLGAGDAG